MAKAKRKEAMDEYHVHIYLVYGKIELDLRAENKVDATQRALTISKGMPIQKPDCDRIAIIPRKEEKE